ncbi:hypothetical protein ACET62_03090 [Aeromonas veronii]
MSFDDLMTDNIEILKKNGATHGPMKASVQGKTIFIMNPKDLIVDHGDLVIRKMSNGAEETFKVIDPQYTEGLGGPGGIPPSYELRVNKLGIPEAKREVQHITYNVNGNNARINQNSIDNSTNIFIAIPEATQLLSTLRTAIDNTPMLVHERETAAELLDSVENQFTTDKPKRSVVKALLTALPYAENFTNIITALTDLTS